MAYISNIVMGILSLPLIALALTLPYLIYQYARFGAISFRKTFMVLVFLFYLICMFYQVILPLPANHQAVVPYAQTPQTDPYDVWRDLRSAALSVGLSSSSGARTWVTFLKVPEVYQALFNVLLTIPFGFMLRYFFKRGILASVVLGFGLSLFFETTQLTGLWGIYAHPYRLFDVCDLELNTLGSLIGSIIALPMVYLLPDLDAANEHAIERGLARASMTRRFIGFCIDAFLCVATAVSLCVVLGIASGDGSSSSEADALGLLAFLFLTTGVFFMLVPCLLEGRTFGHFIVGLRIVCLDGSRPGFLNYLVRYGTLIWVCILLPLAVYLISPSVVDGIHSRAFLETMTGVYLLWLLTLLVRSVIAFFGKPMVMLNGFMSNTTIGTKADARINVRRM